MIISQHILCPRETFLSALFDAFVLFFQGVRESRPANRTVGHLCIFPLLFMDEITFRTSAVTATLEPRHIAYSGNRNRLQADGALLLQAGM